MQPVMIEIAFNYTYIVWDRMVSIIYSSTNPQSITMYVLLLNENIAHASTLERRTGIHVLIGWGEVPS